MFKTRTEPQNGSRAILAIDEGGSAFTTWDGICDSRKIGFYLGLATSNEVEPRSLHLTFKPTNTYCVQLGHVTINIHDGLFTVIIKFGVSELPASYSLLYCFLLIFSLVLFCLS